MYRKVFKKITSKQSRQSVDLSSLIEDQRNIRASLPAGSTSVYFLLYITTESKVYLSSTLDSLKKCKGISFQQVFFVVEKGLNLTGIDLSDVLCGDNTQATDYVHSMSDSSAVFISNQPVEFENDFVLAASSIVGTSPSHHFFYFDEIRQGADGRLHPMFKPDFGPQSLHRGLICDTGLLVSARALKPLYSKLHDFEHNWKGIKYAVLKDVSRIKHVPWMLYHSFPIIQTTTVEEFVWVVNEPLVSIIIPAKNKAFLLKQCVESITQKSTFRNFEIIVIDNGSTEPEFLALVEQYKDSYPGVFFTYTYPIEFNFSKLINYGASKSNGEYYILLNNDVEVLAPDWIEQMLHYSSMKEVGVVGAKLLFPNDMLQHVGVVFSQKKLPFHIFSKRQNPAPGQALWNQVNLVRNFEALTAAVLMVSKEKFVAVGGFDEQFTVDYNDIDFCLKQRKNHLHNVYNPNALLYHYESISRGNAVLDAKKYARYLLESELFLSKWEEYIDATQSLEYLNDELHLNE